jgi:hypothetical protein
VSGSLARRPVAAPAGTDAEAAAAAAGTDSSSSTTTAAADDDDEWDVDKEIDRYRDRQRSTITHDTRQKPPAANKTAADAAGPPSLDSFKAQSEKYSRDRAKQKSLGHGSFATLDKKAKSSMIVESESLNEEDEDDDDDEEDNPYH